MTMFKFLKRKIEESRQRKAKQLFDFGYRYAAAKLLESDGMHAIELWAQVDITRSFCDFVDFNDGVEAALIDFRNLTIKKG